MRNRTYGGVRGRKVSLPCGKLTFLLLDWARSADTVECSRNLSLPLHLPDERAARAPCLLSAALTIWFPLAIFEVRLNGQK